MVESHFQDFELIRERFERLLKIKSDNRTEENLFELMRLTAKLKIFESFKMSAIHKEICKHINARTYERGEIIFKQGDEGDAYYFVLRGCVDLYNYDIDQIDGKTKLKLLASILPGYGFGELALLYECPRTATAIPNSKTEMVVFKKKIYTNLVKDLHEKELFDLVQFYYSIPIFRKEPISNVLKYCLRTNRKVLNAYEPFIKCNEYVGEYIIVKCGNLKAFNRIKVNKYIINNSHKHDEEGFIKYMKDLQKKPMKVNGETENKKAKENINDIYEDVLDVMEFSDKEMVAEYYACKSKRIDIYLLPILPTEVISIRVDDFKQINPVLNEVIAKFSAPILDEDRVYRKLYRNLIWKKSKKNLLFNALKKQA